MCVCVGGGGGGGLERGMVTLFSLPLPLSLRDMALVLRLAWPGATFTVN